MIADFRTFCGQFYIGQYSLDQIFISHSSKNHQITWDIKKEINSWGYKTWIDDDDIVDNSQWYNEIQQALQTSNLIVCIVTREALASHFVTAEWDIAIVKQIASIFLIFDDIVLPSKYSAINFIDFRNGLEKNNWSILKDAIQEKLITWHQEQSLEIAYLNDFYDKISYQLGEELVSTLTTYGTNKYRSAEPVHLTISFGRVSNNAAHLEEEDFFKVLERSIGNVLIVGEEGSGKTTLLLQALRDIIVSIFTALSKHDKRIPIYLDVSQFNASNTLLSSNSLNDWLLSNSVPVDIIDFVHKHLLFLLIDNIECLEKEEYKKLCELIPQNCRVVATSREKSDYFTDFLRPSRFFAYVGVINPIRNIEEINKFVYKIPDFKENLRLSDERLLEIFGSPLMLSLLVNVFYKSNNYEAYKIFEIDEVSEIKRKAVELIVHNSMVEFEREIAQEDNKEATIKDTIKLLQEFALTFKGDKITDYDNLPAPLFKYPPRFLRSENSIRGFGFKNNLFKNYFIENFLFDHTRTILQDKTSYERDEYSIELLFSLVINRPIGVFSRSGNIPGNRLRSISESVLQRLHSDSRFYEIPNEWLDRIVISGGYAVNFNGLEKRHSLLIDPRKKDGDSHRYITFMIPTNVIIKDITLVSKILTKEDLYHWKKLLARFNDELHLGIARSQGLGECSAEIQKISFYKNGSLDSEFLDIVIPINNIDFVGVSSDAFEETKEEAQSISQEKKLVQWFNLLEQKYQIE